MGSRTYIVTGASAGIGRAVARQIADRGHLVIACARSASALEELAGEAGPMVKAVPSDVASKAGIAAIVSACGPDLTEIAGIVHGAASLVPLEPYAEVDPAEMIGHFAVHVTAPIALYRALTPRLTVRRMLYIDSYSASQPRAGWPAYSVIKAAAQMAARAAALELSGTTVIRVFPGAVDTAIVRQVLESGTPTAKVFEAMQDRGELVQPDDAARFIARVLVDLDEATVRSRDSWDFNDADTRRLVG